MQLTGTLYQVIKLKKYEKHDTQFQLYLLVLKLLYLIERNYAITGYFTK